MPSVIWDFNVLLHHHLLSYQYCRFLLLEFMKLSRVPGFILNDFPIGYTRLDACPVLYELWQVSLLLCWNNKWELLGWRKLWILQNGMPCVLKESLSAISNQTSPGSVPVMKLEIKLAERGKKKEEEPANGASNQVVVWSDFIWDFPHILGTFALKTDLLPLHLASMILVFGEAWAAQRWQCSRGWFSCQNSPKGAGNKIYL